jgi:hypothetical protein
MRTDSHLVRVNNNGSAKWILERKSCGLMPLPYDLENRLDEAAVFV